MTAPAASEHREASLVAELVGLLNDAEHYSRASTDGRLAYLDKRATLLHCVVDATGDESSRYLAQDAEDRAQDAWDRAESLAAECGDPWPVPRDTSSYRA